MTGEPWLTAFTCTGWPFASPNAPPSEVALLAADHVQARPELRRLHLVGDVLEHADDLAAFDLVEDLAAELRVVALLVDRERAVADDRDAAIGRGDEVVPSEILVARQQRHVRHALELHGGPRLRVRAAVRARRLAELLVVPVEPGRLFARRLIVDEDAVLDDVERLGLHAFVVPSARRQRSDLRAIAANVHQLGPVLERAEHFLRRRDEARAGVVRLVAHARDRARSGARPIRES